MKQLIVGLVGGTFVVLALGAPAALRQSHLRFNSTDSVPIGLYEAEAERAPYAGFCLSAETLRSALRAGLELGRGECADGHQPILKTVYQATPETPDHFGCGWFSCGRRAYS